MAIIVNLDVMLARRKMSLSELSERVDISIVNLSILKTGKAKAVRFTTLEAICRALDCQPGDILEYQKDVSVVPQSAPMEFYAAQMGVHKKQIIANLNGNGIIVQAGAMQWTAGTVNATTGIKGVGDFFGKAMRGSVTGESAIKPEYTGTGTLVLEPTYKHILLVDLADWNGSIVLDDGLFLACESTLKHNHFWFLLFHY